jgi:hypothetical protein
MKRPVYMIYINENRCRWLRLLYLQIEVEKAIKEMRSTKVARADDVESS